MKRLFSSLLCVMMFAACLSEHCYADVIFDVPLTNFEAFGDFDDPQNTHQQFFVGPNLQIVAVEWINLVFTTEGTSWQSELVVSANNSDESQFWDFIPANSSNNPGTYSGSGVFTQNPAFSDGGPFSLNADGILDVYVYDIFKDNPGQREAIVTGGTLRITAIPEPSASLLLAAFMGATLQLTQRRRKH